VESPVLKPGGFWICPACGQRNKVWAPCSGCGTALAGMAHPEPRLASGAVADGPAPRVPRTSWILYALGAAGVVAAVVLGVAMSRLLGGAALTGQEDLVEAGGRAAASPQAASPRAEPLRSAAPVAPSRPRLRPSRSP
jgi:hypothetical protein